MCQVLKVLVLVSNCCMQPPRTRNTTTVVRNVPSRRTTFSLPTGLATVKVHCLVKGPCLSVYIDAAKPQKYISSYNSVKRPRRGWEYSDGIHSVRFYVTTFHLSCRSNIHQSVSVQVEFDEDAVFKKHCN
jgi:hypothetical protein